MKIVNSAAEMQPLANEAIKNGKRISFVPTMGALHEGHLRLFEEGRKRGDVFVVSIFVNPTQFGLKEDFGKYPRELESDIEKVKKLHADIVFTPNIDDIYPAGFQTYVEVKELQKHLCGPFRDGHFRGVATVVLKLFNIVKPHVAIFGEKDYQQLRVIKKMVEDLNLEVQVIGFPTIREESGLALSSRNKYLSPDDKRRAAAIPRALLEIKKRFLNGENDTQSMIGSGRKVLNDSGIEVIDYLEICHPDTLERKELAEAGDVIAVAVRLNNTRLIDNMRL